MILFLPPFLPHGEAGLCKALHSIRSYPKAQDVCLPLQFYHAPSQ